MKLINNLKFNDKRHLVLAVVFAIFIVMDIKIPDNIASLVDTVVGKTLVIMVGLSLLVVNPLVGILGAIAAYELIRRSSNSNIGPAVMKFIPTEAKKSSHLSAMNQFPVTVEEQVVADMIPQEAAPILTPPSFKPTQSKLHDAAKLN